MTADRAKRVTVLMGGWSAEREVSLVSGASAAKALEEAGYQVTAVDVQRDLAGLMQALAAPRPDVVFNALHGRGGEDGTIQGVLEFLGVPYTHSGVLAAAVAMDKAMTKRVLETVGVRSPRGRVLLRGELSGDAHPMAPPYIIKPVDEGSTVGVTLVKEGEAPPTGESWTFGERALVEEFVPGRELTVGVMGGDPSRALAVTEIRFHAAVYDYAAKYTAGRTEHIIPADIPKEVYDEAMRLAVLAHETLGCRGVSRSDFRWDDGKPGTDGLFFLEINNQPGMTPLSLVPEQAQHAGVPYVELVSWMVENATCQMT